MSSGERPMGAKGKQSDTEALCQPPPPLRGHQLQTTTQPGVMPRNPPPPSPRGIRPTSPWGGLRLKPRTLLSINAMLYYVPWLRPGHVRVCS